MSIIPLTWLDLAIAAGLILLIAAMSLWRKLAIERQLTVAALRTVVQLGLVGFVLEWVFARKAPWWVLAMAMFMLLVAGLEVMRRQKHRLTGWWGYGTGTLAMFLSSFSISIFALTVIVSVKPWFHPQYAIPLLGMLLGNTMNGIALGLDRLTTSARQQRTMIEGRLILGASAKEAIAAIRRDSMRTALIPIINAMSIAGLVSLPGMMTGQILSGVSPLEAVKYQILIMFLIAAGTGFGSVAAVSVASARLFDHRHRLRLDRLSGADD